MSRIPQSKSVQSLTAEQIHNKDVLKNMTIEQKAHIYDILIDQLVEEGSYSILACGHITSKILISIVELKAEGEL